MWLELLWIAFSTSTALRLDRCNVAPLGMESGAILDEQITASSSFDGQSVGPQNGRIRTELASGAWCPKNQIHANSYEFLQVTLNRPHIITALETQGRFGNGTGREYATHYMIDYWRYGSSQWIRYRNRTGHKIMDGNRDTSTAEMLLLDPPIIASRVRIVPSSKQTRTMCMRIEVHGCPHVDGLLFYFTEPEGSKLGFFDFRDRNFEETELFSKSGVKRGIGSLYDGFVSDRSPYEDTPENGTWIGWNKEKTGGLVNLTFEFDTLRNFSSMEFDAFGEKMERIDVIFSQDGSTFPLASQISSLDQSANRTMRRFPLRVPLHRRTGRVLHVSFSFATEWFFLTEINFNSEKTKYAIDYRSMRPVLFNHSETLNESTESPNVERGATSVDFTLFYYIGFAVLLCFVLCLLCMIFCSRRRTHREKELQVFEGESRSAMIVTTLGNCDKTHIYPTHTYLNQLNGIYSSDKTASISLSSKSNSSSKTNPPSWNDFHFPPPPETSEGGYAEPSLTLPLLSAKNRILSEVGQPSSRTLNRSPKKHKMYVDDSLHYATSNIFTTYGFENVKKFHQRQLAIGVDLGEGKFTLVRECMAETIPPAAHKCAKERGNIHARKALLDELRVLSTFSHPHIVELFGMDEDAGLILELMVNGDVRALLKANPRVGLNELLSICADVCDALTYLEKCGVIHGHLTPGNVLIGADMRAKLSAPRGQSHHAQLRYSSPESILLNQWTNKADMWAYAVTCWEILNYCSRIPYEGLNNADLIENAERMLAGNENSFILRWPEVIPRVFRDTVAEALRADLQRRPDFAAINSIISKFHSSLPSTP